MKTKNNHFCIVEDFGFESIEKVFALIGGKWKMQILYHLGRSSILRYGQLKRRILKISHKILAAQLKDLERNKFISRKEFSETPLKVEYQLTDLGLSLLPLYEVIGNWCEEHQVLFL